MALTEWATSLEDEIFTIIKARATKRLKEKYPKLKFTTSDKGTGEPTFPLVYIHVVNGYETGKDLEGKDINGVYYSMMCEVFTNTSKEDCDIISAVLLDEFKELYFSTSVFPVQSNIGTNYRKVFTAGRYIGQSDKLK